MKIQKFLIKVILRSKMVQNIPKLKKMFYYVTCHFNPRVLVSGTLNKLAVTSQQKHFHGGNQLNFQLNLKTGRKKKDCWLFVKFKRLKIVANLSLNFNFYLVEG